MAEQRLIDANKAIEIAKECYLAFGISNADLTDLRDVLEDCTTVDAKPVVHAHWVSKDTMEKTPYAKNHYCSNCKVDVIECGNFCTNCGAQMDESEDKNEIF